MDRTREYDAPGQPRRRDDPYAPDAQAEPIGAAAPPPAIGQPAPPADRRAAPTNFTNFARRFAANKGVAEREAGKYGQQAGGAAGKAAGSLATAQTTFANGVNTGSVAPPPGSNAPAATNVGGAAPVAPPAQPPQPVPPSNSQALTGQSTKADPTGGLTLEQMLAEAGKQYTGPMGLDTKQASTDALAAEEQLNALKDPNGIQTLVNESGTSGTRGADNLSGSLIGAAGRKEFDALRAKFNPNKALSDAQDKATKQAEEAQKSTEANAAGWDVAAKNKAAADGRQAAYDKAKTEGNAAKAKAADLANVPPDYYQGAGDLVHIGGPGLDGAEQQEYMLYGVNKKDPTAVAKRMAEIKAYAEASTTTGQNDLDSTFNDINSYMSPSTIAQQADGGKDASQAKAQGQFNPGGTASNSGSTDNNVIPWGKTGAKGFFVWRSMTPADWREINQLNGNAQRQWIDNRADQLQAKAKWTASHPSSQATQ